MTISTLPMPWLIAILCLVVGLLFDETSSVAPNGGRKTIYAIVSAFGWLGALFFFYVWIAL